MQEFDRYGAVNIDDFGFISSFEEKAYKKQGLINGGIYLISKDIFDGYDLENSFSFEEFLQKNYKSLKIKTKIFNDYFIDIGIPQDYERFCKILSFN